MAEVGNSSAKRRSFTVGNKQGIHARPAALIVKVANQFEADVFVEKDDVRVNGKSIMGLMMLAAGPGSILKVEASGKDAEAVLDELETLVNSNFEED